MKQRWWLVAVGVLGVVLAVLLFPRPDTGADIPPPNPDNADPLDFKGEGDALARGDEAARRRGGRAGRDREGIRGPLPNREEILAKRSRPDAVLAARMTAPFSSMRRVLIQQGGDELRPVADQLMPPMELLRDARRDPDAVDWDQVHASMEEAVTAVRESSFASNPEIQSSLARYDELMAEWDEAMKSREVAQAPSEEEEAAPEGADEADAEPTEPAADPQ